MASGEAAGKSLASFQHTIDGNAFDYSYIKFLGKGGFARADLYSIKRPVVLKRVFLDSSLQLNERALQLAEAEAQVLATLCHSNIVRIYHAWKDSSNNQIIMELEYCGGNSLKRIINEHINNGTRFTARDLTDWLSQLALGIAYLHDLGIVHRDLKPDNVLLSTDMQTIKIADFGTAKLLDKGSTLGIESNTTSFVGTVTYMAPETFSGDGDLLSKPKVDVWALGVIAYEMATLELPFRPATTASNFAQVIVQMTALFSNKKVKLDKLNKIGEDYSQALKNVIAEKLLVISHHKRGSISDVCRDSFFVEHVKKARESNYIHEQIRRLKGKVSDYQSSSRALKKEKEELDENFKKMSVAMEKTAGEKDRFAKQMETLKGEIEKLRTPPEKKVLDVNFFGAAHEGNVDRMKKLMEEGADVNSWDTNNSGFTPLMYAINGFGSKEAIAFLLKNGANVHAKSHTGRSAVAMAAISGKLDIVQLLIENNANVQDVDDYGRTVLMEAVCFGSVEMVRLLITKGADIHAKTKAGRNALMEAADSKNVEKVKLLLQNRAQVDSQDDFGRSALLIAASCDFLEAKEVLLSNGASMEDVKRCEDRIESCSRIDEILKNKSILFDFNYLGYIKPDPQITTAIYNNDSKTVEKLIQERKKGDPKNDIVKMRIVDGLLTPLQAAVKRNYGNSKDLSVVEVLLKNGSDPNDERVWDTIVDRGYVELAKLLLKQGAKPKVPGIVKAVRYRHHELVEILLESSTIKIDDIKLEWLLTLAAGDLKMAQLLIKYGADVNAKESYVKSKLRTAIMLASSSGNIALVRLLIDKGADVGAVDRKGMTALTIAAVNDDKLIALATARYPDIKRLLDKPATK